MPRRKEKGRTAPQVDRQRFDHPAPADVYRARLGKGCNPVAGSRILARREKTAWKRRAA